MVRVVAVVVSVDEEERALRVHRANDFFTLPHMLCAQSVLLKHQLDIDRRRVKLYFRESANLRFFFSIPIYLSSVCIIL